MKCLEASSCLLNAAGITAALINVNAAQLKLLEEFDLLKWDQQNEETNDDSEVNDNFPGETLIEINIEDESWFANFASDIMPKGMRYYSLNLKNYGVCSKIAFMQATILYAPGSTIFP
ncbi:hypothetical protein Tco_1347395 [Tanacetum coccineum]